MVVQVAKSVALAFFAKCILKRNSNSNGKAP